MAKAASVTVSIADEQSGIWSRMLRVNWVEVSVSDGKTSERAGIKSTSSNVRPSVISAEIIRLYQLLISYKDETIFNGNRTARHFGAGSLKTIFLAGEVPGKHAHTWVASLPAQAYPTNDYRNRNCS